MSLVQASSTALGLVPTHCVCLCITVTRSVEPIPPVLLPSTTERAAAEQMSLAHSAARPKHCPRCHKHTLHTYYMHTLLMMPHDATCCAHLAGAQSDVVAAGGRRHLELQGHPAGGSQARLAHGEGKIAVLRWACCVKVGLLCVCGPTSSPHRH